MQRKNNSGATAPYLTRGSVLDDLGFSPAEVLEIKVKIEVHRELVQYIKQQKYTQRQVGKLLTLHQPDVSNLLTGKISKFSVGKLLKFAGKLNLGAQITLTKPAPARVLRTTVATKPQKRLASMA
jgi:predicted XRE-type DNA-binding protein